MALTLWKLFTGLIIKTFETITTWPYLSLRWAKRSHQIGQTDEEEHSESQKSSTNTGTSDGGRSPNSKYDEPFIRTTQGGITKVLPTLILTKMVTQNMYSMTLFYNFFRLPCDSPFESLPLLSHSFSIYICVIFMFYKLFLFRQLPIFLNVW